MKLILRIAIAFQLAMIMAVVAVAQSQAAGTTSANGVIFIDHTRVAEGFKKAEVLVAADAYRIHAGFRDKAGIPEIHEYHLDIFYVTEGTATFITGGTPVDPQVTKPGEMSAKEIKGGESRLLVAGDVIVIPAKVPHWFKDTSKSFKYFVVKVKT